MGGVKVTELRTPAILIDLDTLERNIADFCALAKRCGKQVWPMVKTHKSTEIAKMQADAGCTGFLCGTLDECEALAAAGYQNIMYAYPVATEVSIHRAVGLAKKCSFTLRMDCTDAAEAINACAEESGVKLGYTVIVDAGLHRFGIEPEYAAEFVRSMERYESLVFRGVSTHPGHVYASGCHADIASYVADECSAVERAVTVLKENGYACEIVSSGSTPTFRGAIADGNLTVYHPGNYVFNDSIQLSIGTAAEQDCALTVLASVSSHPRMGVYLCDAGAKCLGLDQGAHGNASIKGYGTVLGHPELTVVGLSEEVGKLKVNGQTELKVGDRIRIIPNHSCSSANLTSYYIGVRADTVERLIAVDIRGNSVREALAL